MTWHKSRVHHPAQPHDSAFHLRVSEAKRPAVVRVALDDHTQTSGEVIRDGHCGRCGGRLLFVVPPQQAILIVSDAPDRVQVYQIHRCR